jgi:3-phosphoshikimate 1-carboxyvinyltransferase
MNVTVSPSFAKGTVTIPASKSAMQRACAAALIKGGVTRLANPGVSADDQAALQIIQQLGATVRIEEGGLFIGSDGVRPKGGSIHCGESGLSVRMFTTIAATADVPIEVSGSGSLLKRPLHFFSDVLPQLGVDVTSSNGLLPLTITGPLQCRDITVDGSLSSQYITGLLFAYSAAGARDVTITVNNLNSRPYVDLTLDIMQRFGLPCPVNQDYKSFYFPPDVARESLQANIHYAVESDWSSASFLLVAGAISGSLAIRGLDLLSTQADRAVLQALMQSGAVLHIEAHEISIEKSLLRAFQFDATQCPDLFPPLVALAAHCKGTTVLQGVHRLAHKESDRALTLTEEFNKLGIAIRVQDDLMLIEGGAVKGARVHSRHDHRIAMACAVASLKGEGPTIIENAEAVDKSYPQFWDHLRGLGVPVAINESI